MEGKKGKDWTKKEKEKREGYVCGGEKKRKKKEKKEGNMNGKKKVKK